MEGAFRGDTAARWVWYLHAAYVLLLFVQYPLSTASPAQAPVPLLLAIAVTWLPAFRRHPAHGAAVVALGIIQAILAYGLLRADGQPVGGLMIAAWLAAMMLPVGITVYMVLQLRIRSPVEVQADARSAI